jgi:hypothetical protein
MEVEFPVRISTVRRGRAGMAMQTRSARPRTRSQCLRIINIRMKIKEIRFRT